nr:hypothetical protein CFP56_38533 [Quercus suber]
MFESTLNEKVLELATVEQKAMAAKRARDSVEQKAPSEKQLEEEGGESPTVTELAEQIDSHVEVIDMDNSATNVASEGPNAPEVNLALTLPTSGEVSSISPTVA